MGTGAQGAGEDGSCRGDLCEVRLGRPHAKQSQSQAEIAL